MHFHCDFLQKQGGIVARFSIGRSAPTKPGAVSAGIQHIWLPKTSLPDCCGTLMGLWQISRLTLATLNH